MCRVGPSTGWCSAPTDGWVSVGRQPHWLGTSHRMAFQVPLASTASQTAWTVGSAWGINLSSIYRPMSSLSA